MLQGNNATDNNSVGGYVPPQQADNADGGGEAGQDYYYYEMPDGSIGYITANEYNQMYSAAEPQQQQQQQDQYQQQEAGNAETEQPQPAGYVEPTYGQGTAYAPAQEQYVTTSQINNNQGSGMNTMDNNANVYYSYVNNGTGGNVVAAPPLQQPQQYQQPQPVLGPRVVYAEPPGMQQQQQQQRPGTEALMGADAMTAATPPTLPHETASSGWYIPPPSFEAMRKWNGSQKWTTSLCRSCWKEPCFCLGACVAPWCVVAAHRRRLLQRDFRQYRCCAGVCGQVDTCECCGDTPRCSLFWEVLFCLPCSCHANRYMILQRYNLEKSCWDSTVLGLGCFCAPFHWCGECNCWFPESMWDWLYVVTYAWMLTQQHRELDAHEKPVV